MEYREFNLLPDDTRLWVYGFERQLTPREKEQLEKGLNGFISEWNSHGDPVTGAFKIAFDRFVLLSGYMPTGISGCSIDSSVQQVRAISEGAGPAFSSGDVVFYRDDDGNVQAAKRELFQQLAAEGDISSDTPVFDLTLTKVGDLKQKGFENLFRESWHHRVFDLAAANV
ncbi:MAG: hypothetical protein GY940_42630 [bacterium]|nr:hypothetical protein [bacterium]